MARASISAYSATQTSNTLITDDSTDISIAEGFAAANINNAIRTMMTHLADAYAGDAAYDSVTNSVSAGATQTQAGATALTTTINRVTTVGTNGDGVKLPTAVGGLQVLVINDDSAQTLKVWPNTSDAIDGGSANAVDGNQIAAGASRLYIAVDATNWYTALNDLGTIPLGVTSGGSGAATFTDGGILLGSGTGAITATAVLADGEILVGNGSGDPVAESGATARTSLGLGTGDSPTFTTVTASTSVIPDAAGGADLGSTSAEWGDVYIADDKKLYLGNDQNFSIQYDESGNDTTAIVAAGGVSFAPHGTSGGNTTPIQFQELAANGAHYIGFKAPDSISANVTWTLPNADGSANQVIKTDGSGALSWTTVSAAVTALNNATESELVTVGSTTTELDAESGLTFDGSTLTVTGTMGVVTAKDLGSGLHVRVSDSGASSVEANGDDLVIETSANTGMTIFSGTSNGGYVNFGDSGGTIQGSVHYDHNTDILWFRSNNGWAASLNGTIFSVGADESLNGNMTTGVNISQGSADNEIFALKSSDVSHGRTSEAETDSYFIIKKQAAADGGAYIKAFTDDNFVCLKVLGYQRDANGTSPGTGVEGAINWAVKRHDGSNSNVNHDTNEIVYSWAAQKSGGGRAVMVLDSDGGLFLDDAVGSAFDDYDDAALLRTFSTHSAPADQTIKTEFDKWVGYNFKDLQAARIISDPDEGDGDPMWNIGQHTKLLTGAAVQNRAMIETIKSVVDEMMPGFANALNKRLAAQSLPALPV